MTYLRLPYDDAAPPAEMVSDGIAARRELDLPSQRPVESRPGAAVHERTPPYEAPVVPDDVAERAAGMELHLD